MEKKKISFFDFVTHFGGAPVNFKIQMLVSGLTFGVCVDFRCE
jgi:hypothetical protein